DDRSGTAVRTQRGPAAGGVDPPRLPVALSPHPDDYHGRDTGRAAAAAGRRGRRRDAPTAGPDDHRRADAEPDPYALHHAGGLSVPGPRAPPLQPMARCTHRRRSGKSAMSCPSLKITLRPLPALFMALS